MPETTTLLAAARPGLFPRRRFEERMDCPDLPADQHQAALAGLRRINAASHIAEKLARIVIAHARQRQIYKLRLLDVACGGGDVPIGLLRAARAAGVEIELTLVDRSATALAQAERLARESGVVMKTALADATMSLPDDSFDVVTNSLFLHHLDEPQVIAALANMKRAGRLLLISDLRRSPLGWALAWVGCRTLSRSPVVHYDGPVSVRGAWTVQEMRTMAQAAGLNDAIIREQWPFRMLLRWERDG